MPDARVIPIIHNIQSVLTNNTARILARTNRPSEEHGGYEFLLVLVSNQHRTYSLHIDAPQPDTLDGDIPDVGDLILGYATPRFFTSTGTFEAAVARFEPLRPRPISVVLSGPQGIRVVTHDAITPEHAMLDVLKTYPGFDLIDIFNGKPADIRFPLDNIIHPSAAAFEPLHGEGIT